MSWKNNWEKRDLREVSGVFDSPAQLERALSFIDQRGFRDDVSVLMTDKTRDRYSSTGTYTQVEEQTKTPEGAAAGGVAGGVLGAIVGGLTLVGAVAIPGAGLLAAGPVIGALTGGAVGASGGALIGALAGAGIPEHEAKFYEESLHTEGRSLLVAHVPEAEVKAIKELFKECGAHQVKVTH